MTAELLPAEGAYGVAFPAPARRRGRPLAWWGMVIAITTESMLFVGLLSTYAFLRASAPQWPPPGVPKPEIFPTFWFSLSLVGSSLPVWWAERGIKRGRMWQLRLGLLVGWCMAAAFLGHTLKDYVDLTFGWRDHAYGSVFYMTTGLHTAHLIVAMIFSLGVMAKAWGNRYDAQHHRTVEVFGLYWHFVDAVWIFVFFTLFVSEHIS